MPNDDMLLDDDKLDENGNPIEPKDLDEEEDEAFGNEVDEM
ncbi:MAG: hypothetical protein AAB453_03790 [Patescibacteria group bacterium]